MESEAPSNYVRQEEVIEQEDTPQITPTEKIRNKLQKQVSNMQLGDSIKVRDTANGEDYEFVITKTYD